ncbi:MAG: TIGR02452 family protein [Bacteroidia bacterium]|nr:TIGR02452 family protein [Bacteroidia bacterium]
MSRDDRAKTGRETLAILEDGYYISSRGKKVEIKEATEAAIQGSIHYPENSFESVFERRDEILRLNSPRKTVFGVNLLSSLEASYKLLAEAPKVLCLNFASAKNPGGGFLGGAQAQEESLARSSALYPCIAQMKAMYTSNRLYRSTLYHDDMIYSPDVPVFRNDNAELLENPYPVSFITAPAVNYGTMSNSEKDKADKVMLNRTEKLLSVAIIHNHRHLVLGAWGCGVFRNNPERVAGYFRHHLIENPLFNAFFEKIVFAILAASEDNANARPFIKAFGRK